jgi:23S rRNA pseudouridine2604 synthase
MSDFDNKKDDPWAKWRKPDAPAASKPAARQDIAVDAEKTAKKLPAEARDASAPRTLSVNKSASTPPVRVAAKKPYKAPSAGKGVAPVATNTADGVRLSKVMSERGMCSRREADLWIERGWVLVNGERISELGSRIDPQAEIVISKEATKDQAKQVTVLLNKPIGYVSGQPEPDCVPAIKLILAENQVKQSGDPEFKPWMLRGLGAGRSPRHRLDRLAGFDPGRPGCQKVDW